MGRGLLAATLLIVGCSSSGSTVATSSGTGGDTTTGSQCNWPANLYDGGPGACIVGRAFVECQYPVGVVCEGGPSATGGAGGPGGTSSGITQLCISDSTTSCGGCMSSSGTATCADQCAADEYAISCGGPPAPPLPDGGTPAWIYQAAPDGCVGAAATPGGNAFYCCPCP